MLSRNQIVPTVNHIIEKKPCFFTNAKPTEIYTLSLHDALPICSTRPSILASTRRSVGPQPRGPPGDRKSTRLNSSHRCISYAVFCLKKKKSTKKSNPTTVSYICQRQ